ncbi:hypothetical protein JZ751_020169 [Albula glossodonta]|uniref:Uncharacterized protein n=1 Tax=Albula glossodonta TaxID=121402 RepID=A0A8T2NKR1_9TELE|nr:hypothetical protein JZ751_020169 [Albula glossodonta]
MRAVSSMPVERDTAEFQELDSQESEISLQAPHWVAELFPPRFTVLDFLEGSGGGGPGPPEPSSPLQLASEKAARERSRRVREFYRSALRETQLRELLEKRERLSKMIVREGEEWEMDPEKAGSRDEASSQQQKEEKEEEEEEGKEERAESEKHREARWRLQSLLGEQEGQLCRAKRTVIQQALLLDAVKTEGLKKEAQLELQAAEAKKKREEARKAVTRLRKAEEEARELKRENANLVWELARLKEQLEEEGRRQAKAARRKKQKNSSEKSTVRARGSCLRHSLSIIPQFRATSAFSYLDEAFHHIRWALLRLPKGERHDGKSALVVRSEEVNTKLLEED